MLSQEAKELEHIVLSLTESQFEELVAKLPEMERDLRIHRAAHKLFTDVAYYRYMKEAFKETVAKRIYEEANAK